MIERIRNFLCSADPIGMTFFIVIGLIVCAEVFFLGGWEFIFAILLAAIFGSLVFAVALILYKVIGLLQRFCK